MKYKISPMRGGYRAEIVIPLAAKGGELVVRAQATFEEVRRELQRAGGVGACYDRAVVEGFFGDVGKFLKKATKSKALRRAVRTVGKVVKSPAFSAAVAMVPGVGVPIAGGIQAAIAGERLLTNATKAPKGSRKRIAARTVIKAAKAVAKRQAAQRRMGIRPAALPRATGARAFRYLVQLQPAA